MSLATETSQDPMMQALKHQIIKGWPHIRSECSKSLQDFWNYRDELSVLDGLVLKGSCIDRTKLCARDSVYWPSINKDIESLIKTCDLCQEHSSRNKKDPSLPRDIPIQAWSTIQMDLFMLEDHTFLLVVDMTSRFPVVRILNSETTKSVLNTLKGVYCNFGLPKKVLTDNNPCFKSVDFNEFCTKLGVTTDTISSYNHASLGSAERMIQTVKQIMV